MSKLSLLTAESITKSVTRLLLIFAGHTSPCVVPAQVFQHKTGNLSLRCIAAKKSVVVVGFAGRLGRGRIGLTMGAERELVWA